MARRRYQRGTVFLRGRHPVWVGRWLEDFIGETGEVFRRHKSKVLGDLKSIPTEKLALRRLEQELREINSVNYLPKRTSCFETFAQRWLAAVATQFKPSTQASVKSVVKKNLIPFFGKISLGEITTETVQEFVSSCGSACGVDRHALLEPRASRCGHTQVGLEPEPNKCHALSPKTIRNCVITLRSMWRTAKAWGYVQHNPFDGLVLPRIGPQPVRVFTLEEVRKILAAAQEPYRTFYWLLAETGLRAGEAAGLRWEDVETDRGVLQVRQSTWNGKAHTPKSSGAVRRIGITQQLSRKLGDMAQRKGVFCDVPLVFQSRSGSAYRPDMVVKRKLHPLLKTLGIEKAGLHAFRHFNASLMDSLGAPVKVRQQRLGHSDPSITLGRYTHILGEAERQVSDQIYASIQEPQGMVQ